MKAAIILAAVLALAGCGKVAPNNQLNALEAEVCAREKMDAELVEVGFFVRESVIQCVPVKLTAMERLDFLVWIEQRKTRFESQQKVTE